MVDFVPFSAIADAELQSKIDAQSDEQHREIYRNQIKRPDHQHAERRRNGQAYDETDEYGKDDPRPAQRHPKNEQHNGDRHGGIERGVFLDGGEFLVGHGDRAGEAQARLILAREIEVRGGLPNGGARLAARLQLRIVEHRLDIEEPAEFVGSGRTALNKLVPGKARRLSGVDLLERIGGKRQRPSHIVQRDLAALHAEQPELQGLDHAAQARIAGQDLHQPLSLREHFKLLLELISRLEQEAVLSEESTALRLQDRTEQIRLRRQPFYQCLRRLIGQFRRRRIDHRNDQFELREGLLECGFALPPRNVARDELVDVGRHGKMRGGVPRRSGHQNQR